MTSIVKYIFYSNHEDSKIDYVVWEPKFRSVDLMDLWAQTVPEAFIMVSYTRHRILRDEFYAS